LLPGCPDGGVRIGGVFQFNDRQRQAVDEQHEVRPAAVLVLGDAELIHGQPVVARGIVEVQHLRLRAANLAPARAVVDGHTVHQEPVQRAIALEPSPRLRVG
jgi:hypothetical protein